MNEKPDPEPGTEKEEDRFDSLLRRFSERRKESIRQSLERPLKMEVLRTAYLIGCVLLDFILTPITIIEILGHDLLYVAILVLLPLAYLEIRIYQFLFHLDEKRDDIQDKKDDEDIGNRKRGGPTQTPLVAPPPSTENIHRDKDHRRAGREEGVTVAKDFYFTETLE